MSNGPFLESIVLGGEKLTIRDPNAEHDISMEEIISTLYPVGSVIIRYDTLNPGEYLNVGTWSLIRAGKYLLTTSGGAGKTGGSNSVELTVNNLPAHSHTAEENGTHSHSLTIKSAGAHSHNATTNNTGNHMHSASANEAGSHNHNLKGWDSRATDGNTGFRPGATGQQVSTQIVEASGNHTHTVTMQVAGLHKHEVTIENSGTHSHTGDVSENGQHSHTIGETGKGEPFTIEPEYVAVRVWRRTA